MELKPSYKVRSSAASLRPNVVGRKYAISTGHYLASSAAARILERGGNAIDAGVAASMALAILQPDIVSFAGVAPTLIHHAKSGEVVSLAGLGHWPAATEVDRLRREGGDCVPEGILRQVVPAAPATHIEALRRFGSISFREAAAPAWELAREGFAVYPLLAASLAGDAASYRRWASSAEVFLPGGKAPAVGELFRQIDLARTIEGMMEAEGAAAHERGREAGLRAVHNHFYKGPIAQAIDAFHRKEGGFMRFEDLAAFEVPVEPSISTRFKGFEVHVNDVWCQGISLLQALNFVEHAGLERHGHNSGAYLHQVMEAFNLAFADREAFVGDPKFVDVPVEALLSKEYARRQMKRIAAARAFGRMPAPGELENHTGARIELAYVGETHGSARDTIYCAVADSEGNMYSATLSDTSHDVPVVPGTGLVVSSRGSQSRLDSGHPSGVAPGKRPRLTPAPALVMRDGVSYMALGTPGGDVQMQAMLQVFLNVQLFGMPLQLAIEEPRVWSSNFPSSFAPHAYVPGGLCCEENVPAESIETLRSLGHQIELWPRFPAAGGGICSVMRDPRTGLLHAGADPRRECYALAW